MSTSTGVFAEEPSSLPLMVADVAAPSAAAGVGGAEDSSADEVLGRPTLMVSSGVDAITAVPVRLPLVSKRRWILLD
jgi:hypothetical protein